MANVYIIYMHLYIHIYTNIHIYTYIHTYLHTLFFEQNQDGNEHEILAAIMFSVKVEK